MNDESATPTQFALNFLDAAAFPNQKAVREYVTGESYLYLADATRDTSPYRECGGPPAAMDGAYRIAWNLAADLHELARAAAWEGPIEIVQQGSVVDTLENLTKDFAALIVNQSHVGVFELIAPMEHMVDPVWELLCSVHERMQREDAEAEEADKEKAE